MAPRSLPLRSRPWLVLLAVAAACLSGCTSFAHRTLTATASAGPFRVHARDAATAERILAQCQAAYPLVVTGFTTGKPQPVEIYAVPIDARFGEGRNLTHGDPELRTVDCIEIDIGRDPAWENFVIGHELAHAWLDPLWNPLPQIVEEGLADMLGERVDPRIGVWRRLSHGLLLLSWVGVGYPIVVVKDGRKAGGMAHLPLNEAELPTLTEMLRLDGSTYHHVGGEQNQSLLYAVGYQLAREIGIPKLRDLCERAAIEHVKQIPPEWLLEAAERAPDTDRGLGLSGIRLIGPAEQRVLVDCEHGTGPFHFSMD